jgi:predicted O-methyltransferase YrrM
LVFEKVRSGGYIIADNVLWSGKVVGIETKKDADTLNMLAYNEMAAKDERVEPLLVPLRDGLMICRKK